MLVQHALPSLTIPLLGTVPAGDPLEPIEGSDQLNVPRFLLSDGENFALRVRGDSMIDDGIRDGDVLVVKRQATAENGQTVVALVNGEATVKRFFREKAGKIRLQPANQSMEPLIVKERDFTCRGRVVAVLRKVH